jgi:hypothetical protein
MALACMVLSMAVNSAYQFTHTPVPLAWPLAGAAVLFVLLAGCAPFTMRRAKGSLRRMVAKWRGGKLERSILFIRRFPLHIAR